MGLFFDKKTQKGLGKFLLRMEDDLKIQKKITNALLGHLNLVAGVEAFKEEDCTSRYCPLHRYKFKAKIYEDTGDLKKELEKKEKEGKVIIDNEYSNNYNTEPCDCPSCKPEVNKPQDE